MDADGYIRGEGCGVVLLKRLDDALAANDRIELLIKGSSIKHNGTSNGFTAPNPAIITATIKEAFRDANLQAADIDIVEAHGIGNRFTDAMEIQSIYEGYKERDQPVYVGSVKATIGHLEAATGMPMLFKLMGAINNKTIPANINITELNKDVDWNAVNVKVPVENIPWTKENNKPRLAAINLSGYSGTNAHMIFQEAPQKYKSEIVGAPYIFNLSAKTRDSLIALVNKYLGDLSVFDTYTLTEICYTLQNRNALDVKLSVYADTKEDIIQALQDFVSDIPNDHLVVSDPEISRHKDIAFLFTGQGSQYFGMCKGYYEQFEIFRQVIDACDEIMQPYLKMSIKEILWQNEAMSALLNQTQYTQPALFVIEYALAQLWMSEGIQPSALIGHSIGELVALTIAESISLEDALKLVVARATLMQSLPTETGTMASCFCTETDIRKFTDDSNVDIAAINSPRNITIAGKKEDVAAMVEKLKENKIKAVPLQVSHAFHSRLMEPILSQFRQFVYAVQFKEPQIPVISNISGKVLTAAELNGDYLVNHIRNTVQFSKGIETLQKDLGIEIYLECGPAPVLVSLAKQTNTDTHALWLTSSKKDAADNDTFYHVLQQLSVTGVKVDWEKNYIGKKINRVTLPTYAWQWKTYWYDPVRHPSKHVADVLTPEKINQKLHKPEIKVTRETLLAVMQIEAAKILELEAGQKLDINNTYREQGFDSMMSAEFLSRMEKKLHTELKMAVLHEYPTPKSFHQYLIDIYFGGGEIDTNEAVTMADLMFATEMENNPPNSNWHEIQPEDNMLLRWFKKFDKKVPTVKN